MGSPAQPVVVPWRDHAVVIRHLGAGERQQIYEEQLWRVVEWVGDQRQREQLTIALPNRGVRPFGYDQSGVEYLLGRIDRPRSQLGFA